MGNAGREVEGMSNKVKVWFCVVGILLAIVVGFLEGRGGESRGEAITEYDYIVEDFGFKSGNSLPVKEGKVLVELKVFDSGEGYIVEGR